MDKNEEKINAILSAVRGGAGSAFSELLLLYRPLLTARIARLAPPSDTVWDELYQDASLALYRAALRYRIGEGVTFGAFARVCVDNALTSAYRKMRAEGVHRSLEALCEAGEDPTASEVADPAGRLISEEEVGGLYRMAITTLSAYELQVFLSYIRGYTPRQIAPNLGKSEKSVANAIGRALSKLRARLH